MTSSAGEIESFSEFLNSIETAKPKTYLTRKGNRAINEDVFMEMKTYLIESYQDLEVHHSFVDENGTIFDCISIERRSG